MPGPRQCTAALAAVLAISSTTMAAAETIAVRIKDLAFSPAKISAHVGDTIEWTNADFVAHTATETGGAWSVDLPAGGAGRLMIDRAGAADYFCAFHPTMTGRIEVETR